MNVFMRSKKIDNMKQLVFILVCLLPFSLFSQNWADDSNFDDIINEKSAFGDDEASIVIIEFWAEFNEVNAFADFDKVEGAKYFRVDLAKAPAAKKKYRVRMAPTLIIFKDGVKEEDFKAGLDLECPVEIDELQEAIEEIKKAGQF